MKRERYLRRRLHTLHTLNEAVSAMKSLSAHHFRLSRQALPAAQAYRAEIDRALAEVGVSQGADFSSPPGLLLIVSDLGLCGDYNSRLVQMAIAEHHHEEGPLYCVGRRPRAALRRANVEIARAYSTPTSVDGLPNLLLQLAQHLLDDFSRRAIGSLHVVSAKFAGAGRFLPMLTKVFPINSAADGERLRPTSYLTYRRLAAVAVREYLYTTLHELLLDSLASEHGMRLVAAQAAEQWLEETSETVRRQLSATRREATTQEVLDIVAGAARRQIG